MPPPVGYTREKLPTMFIKRLRTEAKNDASFKTGTTGMGMHTLNLMCSTRIKKGCLSRRQDRVNDVKYKDCDIDFLDKKVSNNTEGKHNSPTKNIVMISVQKFDRIKIYHKVTEHKKDIL